MNKYIILARLSIIIILLFLIKIASSQTLVKINADFGLNYHYNLNQYNRNKYFPSHTNSITLCIANTNKKGGELNLGMGFLKQPMAFLFNSDVATIYRTGDSIANIVEYNLDNIYKKFNHYFVCIPFYYVTSSKYKLSFMYGINTKIITQNLSDKYFFSYIYNFRKVNFSILLGINFKINNKFNFVLKTEVETPGVITSKYTKDAFSNINTSIGLSYNFLLNSKDE